MSDENVVFNGVKRDQDDTDRIFSVSWWHWWDSQPVMDAKELFLWNGVLCRQTDEDLEDCWKKDLTTHVQW